MEAMAKIDRPHSISKTLVGAVRTALGVHWREEAVMRKAVKQAYKDSMLRSGRQYDVPWVDLQRTEGALTAAMMADATERIRSISPEYRNIIDRAEWYTEWALCLCHRNRTAMKLGPGTGGETGAGSDIESGAGAAGAAGVGMFAGAAEVETPPGTGVDTEAATDAGARIDDGARINAGTMVDAGTQTDVETGTGAGTWAGKPTRPWEI